MKTPKLLAAMTLLVVSQVCAETSLHGTGSMLSGPLYLKWTAEYRQVQPGTKIEYELKDSSEGVDKALHHGSDFAVVDTPFNIEEERLVQSRAILHLPVALQAVAITYNLPGVPTGLKLSPTVLSGIFLGAIKKWNDTDIKALNPGVDLPDLEIRVIHREEESSLHDLFPAFLAKQDPKWTLKRERERNLHWPVGQNVKGNDKVLEKLRLWPGVIAAVDLPYAVQKKLPIAALKNDAGEFVLPTAESLTAALSGFQNLPEDFQVNLTQSHSKGAYPLCAFSYLLVHQNYFDVYHDHKRGQALVDFLNWVLADGQKMEGDLSYAPLPEGFLSQVKEKVQTIKY
ncbi:MAG TPA: phosphate ABC transporter substrate-binding protein PstS [bacterium]|nr:phosphate ABC transporter substrate-binding protein PstS [bacterium]